MIIWFTGLCSSGKSTIAKALVDRLDPPSLSWMDIGTSAEWLDGDVLRESDFSKGTGFSKEERDKHILRVGYLARTLNKYVPFVVCSFVSPYKEIREKIKADIMVYVKCPLEECMKRDVKGLYKKAKNGEIKNLTGVDAPYEPPEKPDIILETDKMTVNECVDIVFNYIKDKLA